MREADITYRAWADGRCPCCQGELIADDDNEVKTIGEGVQICGWCVGRGHDQDDVVPVLLQQLLTGMIRASGVD